MATTKGKTSRKKKTTRRKSAVANRKKNAADKRSKLIAKLRSDLSATRNAMKAAQKGAREEVRLARSAAKAEAAVLKDQLNAALKREKALRTLAEKKAKMMWAAGQRWEKEQLAKIKKMVGK